MHTKKASEVINPVIVDVAIKSLRTCLEYVSKSKFPSGFYSSLQLLETDITNELVFGLRKVGLEVMESDVDGIKNAILAQVATVVLINMTLPRNEAKSITSDYLAKALGFIQTAIKEVEDETQCRERKVKIQ